MSGAEGLAGTTVTLFGGSDPLDHALSHELGRRGCKIHYVSVPSGWFRSATHVIMRLDTAAGADALEQLAATPEPPSHVIAVCPEPVDAIESHRVNEMCRACGAHHDVSLIWHPPLAGWSVAPSAISPPDAVTATDALATTIADEMVAHVSVGAPAFVARPFVLEEHH
jgi:hypothetical protein